MSLFHSSPVLEPRFRRDLPLLFALPSVTHQLHFLPSVDYIITVENGVLAEQGNFEELIAKEGPFSRLMRDFGNVEEEEEKIEDEEEAIEDAAEISPEEKAAASKKKEAKKGDALMQEEERYTGESGFQRKTTRAFRTDLPSPFISFSGAVGGSVISQYFSAGNGRVLIPLLLFFTCLSQVSTVLTSYFLVWWQGEFNLVHFNRPRLTNALY